MLKNHSFGDRSVWAYYALFFSGAIVVVYQALNLSIVGDSVNFLCLLFLINGFLVNRRIHILENSLLMTLGYILPLLIRNSFQLSYAEAPSILDLAKLASVSSGTTLGLGLLFTAAGFLLKLLAGKTVKN